MVKHVVTINFVLYGDLGVSPVESKVIPAFKMEKESGRVAGLDKALSLVPWKMPNFSRSPVA